MPYVNIKVTKEGVTADQKAQLIQGVTELLVKVLGKNPETTVVVIDEIETDMLNEIINLAQGEVKEKLIKFRDLHLFEGGQ